MVHWDEYKNWPGYRSRPPHNGATLEHLFDRLDPLRSNVVPGQKRWSIACFDCNQKRGQASNEGLSMQQKQQQVIEEMGESVGC